MLDTIEYNKDYYDPNVVYTSFGRNKKPAALRQCTAGGGGGVGHDWGVKGEGAEKKKMAIIMMVDIVKKRGYSTHF